MVTVLPDERLHTTQFSHIMQSAVCYVVPVLFIHWYIGLA